MHKGCSGSFSLVSNPKTCHEPHTCTAWEKQQCSRMLVNSSREVITQVPVNHPHGSCAKPPSSGQGGLKNPNTHVVASRQAGGTGNKTCSGKPSSFKPASMRGPTVTVAGNHSPLMRIFPTTARVDTRLAELEFSAPKCAMFVWCSFATR